MSALILAFPVQERMVHTSERDMLKEFRRDPTKQNLRALLEFRVAAAQFDADQALADQLYRNNEINREWAEQLRREARERFEAKTRRDAVRKQGRGV